jgi:hypothetical protein
MLPNPRLRKSMLRSRGLILDRLHCGGCFVTQGSQGTLMSVRMFWCVCEGREGRTIAKIGDGAYELCNVWRKVVVLYPQPNSTALSSSTYHLTKPVADSQPRGFNQVWARTHWYIEVFGPHPDLPSIYGQLRNGIIA